MHILGTILKQLLFRNAYCRHGKRAQKKKVNLEYFDSELNLGDVLSPIICKWMLEREGIPVDKKVKHTRHLMAVGSILGGNGFFDATVWGSGIKSFYQISSLGKRKYFQKLDIRAVRGPLTREALLACGYQCPMVFGDPAVLMPLIYEPENRTPKGVGVILHFKQKMQIPQSLKTIDISTDDYKLFIDQLCSCEKIISSSLHGIILAETYGIPAIFLGAGRSSELFKYYDWYFSTGRKNVRFAHSLEEAIEMKAMELPDISKMQENILNAFPYDLWEE